MCELQPHYEKADPPIPPDFFYLEGTTKLFPHRINKYKYWANYLNQGYAKRILIDARTQELKSKSINKELGLKRAKLIRKSLIRLGVKPQQILVMPFVDGNSDKEAEVPITKGLVKITVLVK